MDHSILVNLRGFRHQQEEMQGVKEREFAELARVLIDACEDDHDPIRGVDPVEVLAEKRT